MRTTDELANTLWNAIENLAWSELPENGETLCCGPFDEDEFDGLDVTAIVLDGKRFLVVSFDGDAEWCEATNAKEGGRKAAEAIAALMASYD